MRALMTCAVHAPHTVRKVDIARLCNGSEAHFGLVVNKLAQHGFIETIRGRGGGIRLARPASEISVGDVARAFERSTPFAVCFEGGENDCPIKSACKLRGLLCDALDAFYAVLDRATIADLTTGNTALSDILAPA